MQLLLNLFQNFIGNLFALICTFRQLINVISNGSQLSRHLECSLPINLGSSHFQPLCLLLAEGRHTHSRLFRHLLKFLKFVIVHTKFNLPILFPVLDQNNRPFSQFSIGVMFHNRLYLPRLYQHYKALASFVFGTQIPACWGNASPPKPPPQTNPGLTPINKKDPLHSQGSFLFIKASCLSEYGFSTTKNSRIISMLIASGNGSYAN